MKKLETDEPVMKSAAQELGMSERSARSHTGKSGQKRKAKSTIDFLPEDCKRRRRFAEKHKRANFKRWTWADDKPLRFPPQAPKSQWFWRGKNSRKSIPKFSKVKNQQCIQMFAAANWNGKSPLIFNVEKVRMKRAWKRDGVHASGTRSTPSRKLLVPRTSKTS